MEKIDVVNRIRQFNRFYTVQQGLLNKNYLNTDYSVTELRILFEIYQKDQLSANYLVGLLCMDKGYISRLINKLEKDNLVKREKSESDNRLKEIILTDSGKDYVYNLIQTTNSHIGDMISCLNDSEYELLYKALDVVTDLLSRNGNNKSKR